MPEYYEHEVLLEAQELVKTYPASGKRTLVANDHISLRLYRGKTMGLVGESGCGKSTFVRMISQLEQPDSGRILFRGQDMTHMKGETLRQNRRHIQMVFQDPTTAFSDRMKVKDIVCEPLLNFGLLKRNQVDDKAKELLSLVELGEDFADRHPHNMSGGQRQRIGIARALALEPEILICDEATSALDVSVQKNIIDLLARLKRQRQLSVIFICHDLALVRSMSDYLVVMYLGNVVEIVDSHRIGTGRMHPYTEALKGAIFSINMDRTKEIQSIESEAPSPLDLPQGCPFQERCDRCMERCGREKPVLREVEPGHSIACHLFEEEGR